MTKRKAHRRAKRGDRLITPGASAAQVACDHACAALDRLAVQMDREWGIDQLPALVSPETAAKYGRAIAALNAALEVNNPDDVTACANNCIRGLQAMAAEADASGAPRSDPQIWEYDLDGFRFGVMPDGHDWRAAKAKRPDLQIYTMREVANALKAYATNDMVQTTKRLFPGAEIDAIRPRETTPLPASHFNNGGDPIPF